VYRNSEFVGSVVGTRFTISGLKQYTSYNISVMAFDAAKNRSAQSASVVLRTADGLAPTVPGATGATVILKDKALLTWGASADNVGVTGYNVYVNGTLTKTVTANRTELTGLTPFTNYNIRIQALDAARNRSARNANFTLTTMEATSPSTPSNVSTSSVTKTGFTVTWTPSTDNVGVVGYRVFRNGTLVTTVRDGLTSYMFAGLPINQSHVVTVSAIDAANNVSPISAELSVNTTPVLDTTPPTAPTNATSSNVTSSQVRLTWTAAMDNVTVTAYNIYRNGVYFGTANAMAAVFTARLLSANTEYTFTIRAVDAEQNVSAPSNPVTVTTLP
jgi:chitodextrinase